MKFGKTMMAYTDYPFTFLGDKEGEKAPVRKIKIVAYDGNKYVTAIVGDTVTEIKRGFIYYKPERFQFFLLVRSTKKYEVISNSIPLRDLKLLPQPPVDDKYYSDKIKAFM